MAKLNCTMTSRSTASYIICEALNIALEKSYPNESVFHAYLELCEDTNIIIRRHALSYLSIILKKISCEVIEEKLLTEVIIRYS